MTGEILNKQGERIDYSFHAGARFPQSLVVFAHGVTGHKDRPLIIALAEALGAAGIPALRISFSGNGGSEGRFVDSNISKAVEDLGAVLDAVQKNYTSVGVIGLSMGGAAAVLRASRDSRIKFLVSVAGMVNTKAFADREFGGLKPGASFMWNNEKQPLSQAFVDDLTRIGSVTGCAREVKVPWLLVHGSADQVVPIDDSREIFSQANQPKELVEIPGADHTFTGEFTAKIISVVAPWVTARLA